jgi:GH15 family glucan-1,4-alpha-glucosidase
MISVRFRKGLSLRRAGLTLTNMALRIEDYALLGDTQSAALVGRNGSIDWMCVPRFDSGACFAALLGGPKNGRWLLAPRNVDAARTERRYREGTLVLETTFQTSGGRVRVTDVMPPRDRTPDIVRVVEGLDGDVEMRMELVIRCDYGSTVPWVSRLPDGRLRAIAGPDAFVLQAGAETHGEELTTVSDFRVHAGQKVPFVLSFYPSHEEPPAQDNPLDAVRDSEAWWRAWSSRCRYQGPFRDAVVSSLITLKALTYAPTGGIVAAPTTSLPEWPGGTRNWDYRHCWLRDATFTLYALTVGGYDDEARAWRDWLLRAVAGDPSRLQALYGISGERRLTEHELPWLTGYEGARPVRTGNAAFEQLQLDVYGEVLDTLYQTRKTGLSDDTDAWNLQVNLLEFLEGAWQKPDEGIWEVRGARQHFTHSKVMAWVAFDRAVKAIEQSGAPGPLERWRTLRAVIHRDVCTHGYDASKRAFTQAYGSERLDASLLLMPQVGFLPATDDRVAGTVRAIERELVRDGFVLRYPTKGQDGLPPGEGAFLACSFWLADAYALMQRTDDAKRLFERLLAVRNDLGFLAEEYDPVSGRQLGNFPQAFSHVGLVNTAYNLTSVQTMPAHVRRD